jgi:hypothetical protein
MAALKCYFYGSNLSSDKLARRTGVISFAIPDYGVMFRQQHTGDTYECEYTAALALIRFLELNRRFFRKHSLKLQSDSAIVVYQVNKRIAANASLVKLRDLVLMFQRKLGFQLEWIPSSMNRAEMSVEYSAVNPKSPQFNYDIFEEHSRRERLPRSITGSRPSSSIR